MPTFHRFTDRPGYYIRGVSKGKPLVLELTPEGEQYLLETLSLAPGGKFAAETFRWLYQRKWAQVMDVPPPEVPVEVSASPRADSNQGVLQIRLSSGDHVALDQCAEEIVQALADTGASVFGPIPLHALIEKYIVLRESSSKTYELRFYQRLLQVRQPSRAMLDAMTNFRLPREVDLQVETLG
ncbi:MAG: 30S ribosomal protein S10 [Gemmataceae bacterium]